MSENNLLKMRECVSNAALFLQLDDVSAALDDGEETSIGEDTQKIIELLVKCGNLVLSEVAADFLPLKKIDKIISKNGQIAYGDLSKKAVDIFAVKLKGKNMSFRTFYDCIAVRLDGEYTVEYSYEPAKLVLSGESDYACGRLSARTVGYGIACEYCIINGMTDEALLWDKRYKDSLTLSASPKNERRVKARRWR